LVKNSDCKRLLLLELRALLLAEDEIRESYFNKFEFENSF